MFGEFNGQARCRSRAGRKLVDRRAATARRFAHDLSIFYTVPSNMHERVRLIYSLSLILMRG
jgi:hypothetical protein